MVPATKSATIVLQSITQYFKFVTPYYKVVLCTTKHFKVLQTTSLYYKVLPRTRKYESILQRTTLYYKVLVCTSPRHMKRLVHCAAQPMGCKTQTFGQPKSFFSPAPIADYERGTDAETFKSGKACWEAATEKTLLVHWCSIDQKVMA